MREGLVMELEIVPVTTVLFGFERIWKTMTSSAHLSSVR
jgi:hypothetical protein